MKQSQPKKEPTEKFEYQLLECFSEIDFLKELNVYGKKGWRLIHLEIGVLNNSEGTRPCWNGWLERKS
jgi:hypothetical protein